MERHFKIKQDERGQWMYRYYDGEYPRTDWQYCPQSQAAAMKQACERFGNYPCFDAAGNKIQK